MVRISRRDALTVAGGSWLAFSAQTAATATLSWPLELHQAARAAPWRVSPDFYMQKGLKGTRTGGILDSRFPIEELQAAILQPSEDSYLHIEQLFYERRGRAVDPFGALMPIPAFAAESIRRLDPPAEDGRRLGAELLELYWAAELRDIPFEAYDSDSRCRAAARELAEAGILADASPSRLFLPRSADQRFSLRSYFLLTGLKEWPTYGEQRYRSFPRGSAFLQTPVEWLWVQSGETSPGRVTNLEQEARTIGDGRCLGSLVYRDHPLQLIVSAALQLYESHPRLWDLSRPFRHQDRTLPFLLGGLPHALFSISRCMDIALRACWLLKWGVYNYPRPEEVACWAQDSSGLKLEGVREVLGRSALLAGARTALLPQMYPDGCPAHPSYPAGHAVAAGAGVTAIKFFLRSDARLPSDEWRDAESEEEPSASLELDKLAWAISFGRCFAGVHYRCDVEEGIALGERIALAVLADDLANHPLNYNKTIRRFDGTYVQV